MTYEKSNAGEKLFQFGDRGENFYIILSGEVELKTPSPVELTGKKATPEGVLSFFVNFYEDILWEYLDRGLQLKQMFNDEVKALDVRIVKGKFNKLNCLRAFDRAIESSSTCFHTVLEKRVNPKRLPVVTVHRYKRFRVAIAGEVFGDISLAMNNFRGETALCLTECSFATLRRNDYFWSIGQVKKQQLMEEVEKLRLFRFFSEIRSSQIVKLLQFMERRKFSHGKVVYEQGDLVEETGVYFILNGQFEVS